MIDGSLVYMSPSEREHGVMVFLVDLSVTRRGLCGGGGGGGGQAVGGGGARLQELVEVTARHTLRGTGSFWVSLEVRKNLLNETSNRQPYASLNWPERMSTG